MFKNHIKIAIRFFLKNKLFTFINILGLAIGIAAFIFLTQYVAFEKSYDKDTDGVYRVTLSSNLGSADAFNTSATNHPAVGPAIKSDFPEVESYVRLVNRIVVSGSGVISYRKESGDLVKSNINDYKIYFADQGVLDMFNIPLVQGNMESALKDPQSIILSASVAKRFFGEENAVGKDLLINSDGDKIKVTGVFKDLPINTHLKFDMLVSFASLNVEYFNTNWVWPEFYNYIKLKEETTSQSIEAKLPAFVQTHLSAIMTEHSFEAKMGLQPVKDIHLKSNLKQEMSVNSSEKTLLFLLIIATFVIGIALINFVNLSTAKSMERAKEVGLKKVVGAHRNVLISQFLTESLMINFIATFIAMVLVSLLIIPFNRLVGFDILTLNIWSELNVWITLFVVFLVGGLLAGIYPAFVLSSFRPIQVLKGKFHQSTKGTALRKGLVITQFVIALVLVSGTFIVYSQFSYMQDQELGFKADQNLVMNAPMDVDSTILQKINTFKSELLRKSNVKAVTMTNDVPGNPLVSFNTVRKKEDDRAQGISSNFMEIDSDFLDTYKIKLLSGRNFKLGDSANMFVSSLTGNKVLINESVSKMLGFSNPEDALNQKIVFQYGPSDRTAEIIGVVDNYHQQSLKIDYEPIIFVYHSFYFADYLTFNISGQDVATTIAEIESLHAKFFPRDPFNFFFLDEYFDRQYQSDRKLGTLFSLFSILGIFIAALGLFGLGSHIAMQKVKEISVRKVLGASMLQALILIPKKLLSLVVVSGLIAIPIVYFITHNWLENFAFKVDLSWWMFLLPLLLVLLVALISILMQSFKSALVNPADSLRND